MGNRVDIVHELIERAKVRIAEKFGLPEEVADLLNLVEREVKRDYGGERVTISRMDAPVEAKAAKVTRDYLANLDTRDITSRHGISRATMYRYLKRR